MTGSGKKAAAGLAVGTDRGSRPDGKAGLHICGDRQEAYTFTTVEQLVADFLRDVSAMRGGEI